MAWANDKIIDNQLMEADVTSEIVDMKNIYMVEAYFTYTDTPTGVIQMEFSTNGIDWIIPTGASKALNGSSGSFMIDYIDTPTRYMRLKYVFSSGTGTLNAWFSSKGV